MRRSIPIRPDQPLPADAAWPHTLRPPTVQACFDYHAVILQVHREADARATDRTREFLRHRAVTEAEAAKALVPAQEQKPVLVAGVEPRKPGWFRRLFQ